MPATPDADCQMPCDDDCEIGPVHCWNAHRPNHKPDWHDSVECDERAAEMRELRPVRLVPVDEAEDEW
jgi:hypothetical protein